MSKTTTKQAARMPHMLVAIIKQLATAARHRLEDTGEVTSIAFVCNLKNRTVQSLPFHPSNRLTKAMTFASVRLAIELLMPTPSYSSLTRGLLGNSMSTIPMKPKNVAHLPIIPTPFARLCSLLRRFLDAGWRHLRWF